MANGCRSIARVLGPEPDVARFVAHVEQEDEDQDGSLTQIADCYVMQRASGRAKYEVMTKYRPPLDYLAEISRQFPTLTLNIEWDQPGDELLGCAVLVNGNRNVLELDDLVRCARDRVREVFRQQFQDEWEDDTGCEADLVVGWEILREASRLHCGGQGDEQEEREDNLWTDVREFARREVREDWSSLVEGIVADAEQWRDAPREIPDDRDLIAQNEETDAETNDLIEELFNMGRPQAQGDEHGEWRREGF